jgi:hypothetical protein
VEALHAGGGFYEAARIPAVVANDVLVLGFANAAVARHAAFEIDGATRTDRLATWILSETRVASKPKLSKTNSNYEMPPRHAIGRDQSAFGFVGVASRANPCRGTTRGSADVVRTTQATSGYRVRPRTVARNGGCLV